MTTDAPIGPKASMHSVIDYGQYGNVWRPTPTVTKEVITVEEYDENGKLVKKTVTEKTNTVTHEDYRPLTIYNATFN